MTRLPGALFIVDTTREHIAVKEAKKLKIPIFAMVDTNCDPRDIDYVIPSNDDASKSISKILDLVTSAISDGLRQRKIEKEAADEKDAIKMEQVAKGEESKVEDQKQKVDEKPPIEESLKNDEAKSVENKKK